MSILPGCQRAEFYNCNFTENNHSSAAFQTLISATATGAAYDSEERQPHPRCLPRTRVEILRQIHEWADEGTSRILWLHGPAGAGKSAVAQTMCEAWANTAQLLASFFFSRSSSTRNTIERFVPTLACQMVDLLTNRLNILLEAVQNNPRLIGMEASRQLEQLIINPLQKIISQSTDHSLFERRLFIVVDGLDECDGSNDQVRILDLIKTLVTSPLIQSLNLRVLIASRPEPHIRHAFTGNLKSISSTLSLHGDINDVRKYLEQSFNDIHDSEKHFDTMQYVNKPWPGIAVLEELSRRSGGYFIYASTIIRYIDEEGYYCVDRLQEILYPHEWTSTSAPYMEMDKIYSQILSSARNVELLMRILGCVIVGRHKMVGFDELGPVVTTTSVISTILGLRPGELKMAIRGLHSILRLLDDDMDDLRFYHASFSDYLLDDSRSGRFHIDYGTAKGAVYSASLQLMYLQGAPKSFNPTNEWAVAMLSWTRLGTHDNMLAAYVKSAGQAIPFKDFIRDSKTWNFEMQFRILHVLVRAMAILENNGLYGSQTEIRMLAYLWNLAFLYHFTDRWFYSRDLPYLQKIRILRHIGPLASLPINDQRKVILSTLSPRGTSSYSHFHVQLWDKFLEFIARIEDRCRRIHFGADCKITIYRPDKSFVVIDIRTRLVDMFSQSIANLMPFDTRLIHDLTVRAQFELTRYKAQNQSSSSTAEGSADAQLSRSAPDLSRGSPYQFGVGIHGARGKYGSNVILHCDGTIHCSTFWQANAEYLNTRLKSASGIIHQYHTKRDDWFEPFGLKLWLDNGGTDLQCPWLHDPAYLSQECGHEIWEEVQRRQHWIESIYPLWLAQQVQLGKRTTPWLWNHDAAQCEWQKIHNWLGETLETTDAEGHALWKQGEQARTYQWLALAAQQCREQREQDEDWHYQVGELNHRLETFQCSLPNMDKELDAFGPDPLFDMTQNPYSQPILTEVDGDAVDWKEIINRLIEKEANRRQIWAKRPMNGFTMSHETPSTTGVIKGLKHRSVARTRIVKMEYTGNASRNPTLHPSTV